MILPVLDLAALGAVSSVFAAGAEKQARLLVARLADSPGGLRIWSLQSLKLKQIIRTVRNKEAFHIGAVQKCPVFSQVARFSKFRLQIRLV